MKKKISTIPSFITLPLLAGSLLAISRLPLHLGFLAFFSFIPLFILFRKTHKIKIILISSMIFSSSYTLISLHWLSLVNFGGFLGLFLLFGLYFFLYFAAVNWVGKYKPGMVNLALITFWMSFEYLQNLGELRFPWFNLGYSLAEYNWLIQIADLGGIFLVSAFVILVNYFIFLAYTHKFRAIILSSILVLFWVGYGIIRIKTLPMTISEKSVAMVQASIPQAYKWDLAFADSTLAVYKALDADAALGNPDLIVWPESALPDYLLQRRSKFSRFLHSEIRKHKISIFTGLPRYEIASKDSSEPYKFYNSATLFPAKGGYSEPYNKIVLVPVGERMPFLDIFPILWNIQLGQANFTYGDKPAYFDLGELHFSSLICFEIAFPHLTHKIMQKPTDFIVNLTNDAWFKRSVGTYQHAMLTKFRAVEIRRSIYRAANTGYSMVVSPTGEIVRKSKLFERTTLQYPIIVCNEISFFTKYFVLFPVVCLILLLYIGVSVIVERIRK